MTAENNGNNTIIVGKSSRNETPFSFDHGNKKVEKRKKKEEKGKKEKTKTIMMFCSYY